MAAGRLSNSILPGAQRFWAPTRLEFSKLSSAQHYGDELRHLTICNGQEVIDALQYCLRWRAVAILRILRYLATVRRAKSIPCSLSLITMSSSLSGFFLSSVSMIALSFSFTAS